MGWGGVSMCHVTSCIRNTSFIILATSSIHILSSFSKDFIYCVDVKFKIYIKKYVNFFEILKKIYFKSCNSFQRQPKKYV